MEKACGDLEVRVSFKASRVSFGGQRGRAVRGVLGIVTQINQFFCSYVLS
jgi:hypothetical protein